MTTPLIYKFRLITGKSFLIDKNTNKIQIELEGNSAVILGITEG